MYLYQYSFYSYYYKINPRDQTSITANILSLKMSLSLRSITGNVPVKFSDEVSEALKHNKPVVALVSAIVSEGKHWIIYTPHLYY